MNSYDDAKKMLNTLRRLNESNESSKKMIREQHEMSAPTPEQTSPQQDDITVINDVDVKMLSSDKLDLRLMEDQKVAISGLIDSFREQVSQIVDFKPGMTISQEQIRLDGTITDSDVNFVLIAGREVGLYVNADMLKIEAEVILVLDKLSKFEETFKTAMEPLITQRDNN